MRQSTAKWMRRHEVDVGCVTQVKFRKIENALRLVVVAEKRGPMGRLAPQTLLGVLGHNLVEVLDILNSHHHFARDTLLGIHNPR